MGLSHLFSSAWRGVSSFGRSLSPFGSGSANISAPDAASGNDLAMHDWNPVGGSADADLLPDLDTLTARSRDPGRNIGLMAGGMQTMRDNIVASVLRLSAAPRPVPF